MHTPLAAFFFTLLPAALALALPTDTAPAPDAIICTTSDPPLGWVGYAFTFKPTLNYGFLLDHPTAAVQICQNAGELVSHALGGASSTAAGSAGWRIVPVRAASAALGYVPAAVVITGPDGELDELNKQLGNATSLLYGPPDAIPRELAGQIDAGFPVVLGE
jgi:hypothetical protein